MGCTGKHTKKVEDTTAEILSALTQTQNMANRPASGAMGELKSNLWTELDTKCDDWYMHPRYASAVAPFVDDNKRKYMISSFNDLFI